jgi:hypothetical protein
VNSYHLRRYAIGRQASIPLIRDEYDALLLARGRTLGYLAIEELFDITMSNFEEFERDLLSLALHAATFMGSWLDDHDSISAVQLVARRFANFLTTAHAYGEQLPHLLGGVFATPVEVDAVRQLFRDEYDAALGYRVCVELRRYMQHRGSAVHILNLSSHWVDRPDGRRHREYIVAPQVDVAQLEEDSKVKAAVLAEMISAGVPATNGDLYLDLRPYVRDYVSALGRIHVKVRAQLSTEAVVHDTVILDAIARYTAIADKHGALGLAAMELNERSLLEGRRPSLVSRRAIDRRKRLESKNHLPTHFDTQVITNEVTG